MQALSDAIGAIYDCALDPERWGYLAHDCGQIINPDGLRNQI